MIPFAPLRGARDPRTLGLATPPLTVTEKLRASRRGPPPPPGARRGSLASLGRPPLRISFFCSNTRRRWVTPGARKAVAALWTEMPLMGAVIAACLLLRVPLVALLCDEVVQALVERRFGRHGCWSARGAANRVGAQG